MYNKAEQSISDLPDTPPLLHPLHHVYQIHQVVSLNCTSPFSKPPAELTFFVNNEPVSKWVYYAINMYARNMNGQLSANAGPSVLCL